MSKDLLKCEKCKSRDVRISVPFYVNFKTSGRGRLVPVESVSNMVVIDNVALGDCVIICMACNHETLVGGSDKHDTILDAIKL